MLSSQGVELFERIKRIRRGDPAGRSVSPWVGSEVSKTHTKPKLALSLPADQDAALSYTSTMPGMPAAMLPAMMMMGHTSETVDKPPIKCFPLSELFWSWHLFTTEH